MTIRLLPLLLAFAAALAAAADTPLAGKWLVHNSIGGNESDQTCTFEQNGSELAGSCTSELGTVKITGKVEGKKVSWSYKSEYQGTPLTAKYTGTLDSENRISGTVSVEEFGVEGEFSAAPSK